MLSDRETGPNGYWQNSDHNVFHKLWLTANSTTKTYDIIWEKNLSFYFPIYDCNLGWEDSFEIILGSTGKK